MTVASCRFVGYKMGSRNFKRLPIAYRSFHPFQKRLRREKMSLYIIGHCVLPQWLPHTSAAAALPWGFGQNSCEFSYQKRSSGGAEQEAHQVVRSSCTPILFPKGWLPSAVRWSRGKAPKRRQWRKKRGAFEAAARLARPKERGNRFAATVDKPPRSWGSKGDILFN